MYTDLKVALFYDVQGNGKTTTIGVGTTKVARIASAKTKGARCSSQIKSKESDLDY